MTDSPAIRPARRGDEDGLHRLILALADYEKLAHEVESAPGQLTEALFGDKPTANAIVAEDGDGTIVGFALYFLNFSTFTGRPGLYLEDLFVRQDHRGTGLGKSLLLRLVNIAAEKGYGRVEWSVLDWNLPAIEFYRSLGARPMEEWTVFRLDRAAIEQLAGGEGG